MTLTSFKSGAMTRDKLALTEGEGAALLAKLIDARRKSCTTLGQVDREVAKYS